MNLMCFESLSECWAYPDPVLLNNDKFLLALLKVEDRYRPSKTYFESVQTELTPQMRKSMAGWMLEVCLQEKCQKEVFALSINYLDRFLSDCSVPESGLKALASASLLIASKLRETTPLSAEKLRYHAYNKIPTSLIIQWESLVLNTLKWDTAAVTPQDFIQLILWRIPIYKDCCKQKMILSYAQTIAAFCVRDFSYIYQPSMIACASIAVAFKRFGLTEISGYTLHQLFGDLEKITSIEKDYIQSTLEEIEGMVYSENLSDEVTKSRSDKENCQRGTGKAARATGNSN